MSFAIYKSELIIIDIVFVIDILISVLSLACVLYIAYRLKSSWKIVLAVFLSIKIIQLISPSLENLYIIYILNLDSLLLLYNTPSTSPWIIVLKRVVLILPITPYISFIYKYIILVDIALYESSIVWYPLYLIQYIQASLIRTFDLLIGKIVVFGEYIINVKPWSLKWVSKIVINVESWSLKWASNLNIKPLVLKNSLLEYTLNVKSITPDFITVYLKNKIELLLSNISESKELIISTTLLMDNSGGNRGWGFTPSNWGWYNPEASGSGSNAPEASGSSSNVPAPVGSSSNPAKISDSESNSNESESSSSNSDADVEMDYNSDADVEMDHDSDYESDSRPSINELLESDDFHDPELVKIKRLAWVYNNDNTRPDWLKIITEKSKDYVWPPMFTNNVSTYNTRSETYYERHIILTNKKRLPTNWVNYINLNPVRIEGGELSRGTKFGDKLAIWTNHLSRLEHCSMYDLYRLHKEIRLLSIHILDGRNPSTVLERYYMHEDKLRRALHVLERYRYRVRPEGSNYLFFLEGQTKQEGKKRMFECREMLYDLHQVEYRLRNIEDIHPKKGKFSWKK